MAHPSPSPTGSSSSRRRRLSEVLGEQQEPFSLDLYLLERGCSPAFLDATACGSGGACSTCWPKTRGTGRTLRRPAKNKKGSRRSGVLRMLLSKILTGTTAPAATKKKNRAAIGWRRVVAEKQRTPDSFELALRPASPGAGAVEAHMEDDGGEQEDDEEDESTKKQLSPVSVLEQRLFEHSPPPPPHAPKALAIFGELLEAAYTPNALLDDVDVVAIAKDRSRSTQSEDGRRRCSSTDSSSTPPTTPRARRRRKKKKHARRKEDVPLEKDLGRLTSLVASDMAVASVGAEDLRPSVEDVGVLIAAAVLEALTEETAAELIDGDGDGPRLCG
ncbi:uncharacterized protein LOC8064071 [Sorghum bicolor]|uniref:Uncharacterized protein n=1 Tax=Sorghum bicolor TaxID=4558 RepID=A0A1B6PD44_SORBI|nr:uncharacterized protein LOC8064071 [Sorghum bicolor]KXG23455.1 hypothetical protein SORBI_3008G097500 [Sorghum bicolor]|eukprot:XP_021302098.1 uncharacterized protein LOC8064071 [Sorghum bicolor]